MKPLILMLTMFSSFSASAADVFYANCETTTLNDVNGVDPDVRRDLLAGVTANAVRNRFGMLEFEISFGDQTTFREKNDGREDHVHGDASRDSFRATFGRSEGYAYYTLSIETEGSEKVGTLYFKREPLSTETPTVLALLSCE